MTAANQLACPGPAVLIDKLGCWLSVLSEVPRAKARGALFLDWDCLHGEPGGQVERKRFVPSNACLRLLALVSRAEMAVVLLAHLPAIAAGRSNWGEFTAGSLRLGGRLAREGGRLDAVAACAFDPAGQGALCAGAHPWTPPYPGMVLAVLEALRLDRGQCTLLGATPAMLRAGRSANLGSVIFLGSSAFGAPVDGEADLAHASVADFAELRFESSPGRLVAAARERSGA